jgi:hypothetical protein
VRNIAFSHYEAVWARTTSAIGSNASEGDFDENCAFAAAVRVMAQGDPHRKLESQSPNAVERRRKVVSEGKFLTKRQYSIDPQSA